MGTVCPKISIITPSYNSGKDIERAIKSILQQDYDGWEHIIIDGGSNDNTLDILKNYNHIRWIAEPDKGIYDAMNKGVHIAKGEWIYFLGADDQIYNSEILKKVSYYFDRCDMLYGNVISKKWNRPYDGPFDITKLFKRNICHQSIFMKKKVIENLSGFNLKYKLLADYLLNLKCFANPDIKIKYVDLVIAFYGENGASSLKADHNFWSDKQFLFYKYAGDKVFSDLKTVTRQMVYQKIRQRKFEQCYEILKSYIFGWNKYSS